MFRIMFEKATIFSAVVVFIFFGIISNRYFDSLETNDQATDTSTVSEQY